MFQGVSIKEFNKAFRNEDDCKQYLFDLKWKVGYRCRRCGCTKSNKGKTSFHMRCKVCGYDESVTAHTMFHKLKIPLQKAFGMAFRLSVKKKGMSTTELAREFTINQKSSWLFKRKTPEAMKSSGKYLLDTKVEVDEILIGGPEKNKRGRNKGDKKLVVIAVEKVKGNKIGRAYAEVIEQASGDCFKPFFERYIDKDNAQVITDRWRGYQPLESEFESRRTDCDVLAIDAANGGDSECHYLFVCAMTERRSRTRRIGRRAVYMQTRRGNCEYEGSRKRYARRGSLDDVLQPALNRRAHGLRWSARRRSRVRMRIRHFYCASGVYRNRAGLRAGHRSGNDRRHSEEGCRGRTIQRRY